MRSVSLELFARRCLSDAKAGRLTILAGAGISMLPPSYLPSGLELKRMAIKGVCADPKFQHLELIIVSAPAFATLVPEVLFQRFYDCFGERLLSFFEILKSGRSNAAHELLAQLAAEFNIPILTTNFDGLIETCRGLPKGVLHLHGELADPRQMVIRLHQVGKGLSPALLREAGGTLAGRVLCVLGYSGNDEDVRQLLREYRPREILWLVRNQYDPARNNLQRFFVDFNLSIAQGSLSHFVSMLAEMKGWRFARHKITTRSPSLVPNNWHDGLTPRERYMALSEALLEVRQYAAAARVALKGGGQCPATERPSWFYVEAAEAYRILANAPQALKQAHHAVRLARRYGDYWDRAAALNALGLAHLEKPKSNASLSRVYLRRAKASLLQSDSANWSERVIGFAARLYNNLGLVEMELGAEKPARVAFSRSLRLKRRIGDLSGEGTTAANMAILNAQHGRKSAATRWRRRAIFLIKRYDQQFRAAYLYRRMGGAYCANGELRRGLAELNEALRISREVLKNKFETKLTLEAIKKYAPRF